MQIGNLRYNDSGMITSRTNPQVKHVRKLQGDRRYRYDQRAFVVEGTRWLQEVVAANLNPLAVYVTPAWQDDPEHLTLLDRLDIEPVPVDEPVLATMSDTATSPGVLAVLPMTPHPLPANPGLLLILDAITTPGNLGTMLRTAAAAGVDGVLLGPGTVDPYNPKVVRGSMGALLRLPIVQAEWDELATLTEGMDIWLAAAQDGQPYSAIDWTRPAAILIGNEAQGAGPEANALAGGRVTIPMVDSTESLNAAVAAGILLFEAARQRAL